MSKTTEMEEAMRPHRYVLDDNGEPRPCDDVIEWARWFERFNRTVALTRFSDGTRVSTVFLGLDHAFGGGPPVLWETLVFAGDDGADDDGERYTSRAAAQAGHARMVARCAEARRTVVENVRDAEVWQ